MQIFVDADACPVVGIVEKVAKEHSVPVTLLCDTNENIDQMLMERHLNKKARRASGKNHLKGPRKRIAEEDKLEKVLENPQVIKTPVVRNGKQSTLGYQPDIWKAWK